jgi:hypothetical protein
MMENFMIKKEKKIHHGDSSSVKLRELRGYILLICTICALFITGCPEAEQTGNKVAITFDSNGGSEVASIKINEGGQLPADYLAEGSKIPSRNDYKFNGWLNGTTPVTADTVFDTDTTLKAQWIIKTITVSFDLNGEGDVTTPASIASVSIENGTALGGQFPADPTRAWTSPYPPNASFKPFTFNSWVNNKKIYTADTIITSNSKTFRLIAEWDDHRIITSPAAIHPGNHFNETGGVTRAVKVNEDIIVQGLFSNVEVGVLSSKWYMTQDKAVADAATKDNPGTATVILEQNASPPGNELSLPFTRRETTAGTYYYWVVVTNTRADATEARTANTITQNKLTVTVTD